MLASCERKSWVAGLPHGQFTLPAEFRLRRAAACGYTPAEEHASGGAPGRPRGGVVTQRTANPCTPVRFRARPPKFHSADFAALSSISIAVAPPLVLRRGRTLSCVRGTNRPVRCSPADFRVVPGGGGRSGKGFKARMSPIGTAGGALSFKPVAFQARAQAGFVNASWSGAETDPARPSPEMSGTRRRR